MSGQLKVCQYQLTSITSEYFDHLLGGEEYEDIQSCALCAINNLQRKTEQEPFWIKISSLTCGKNGEKREGKVSGVERSKGSVSDGNGYFIRCQSILGQKFGENVLCVTNEKYFNILKYFNVNIWNESNIFVTFSQCEKEMIPIKACSVTLSHIEPTVKIERNILKKIIKKHCHTPRLWMKNEVVQINLTNLLPPNDILPAFYSVRYAYFKVLEIVHEKGRKSEGSDRVGCWVHCSDENDPRPTRITLRDGVQGYVPSRVSKFVGGLVRADIPLCPPPLLAHQSEISKLFDVFLSGGGQRFKPSILLSGDHGSGKKTVLRSVVEKFGMKLIAVDCADFVKFESENVCSMLREYSLMLVKNSPCVLLFDNIDFSLSPINYPAEEGVTPNETAEDISSPGTEWPTERENMGTRVAEGMVIFDIVQLEGLNDRRVPKPAVIETFQTLFEEDPQNVGDFPWIVVGSTSSSDLIPGVGRMFSYRVKFGTLKEEEVHQLLPWLFANGGIRSPPSQTALHKIVNLFLGSRYVDFVKLARIVANEMIANGSYDEAKTVDDVIRDCDKFYSNKMGFATLPNVHWQDVGGLDEIKNEIQNCFNISPNRSSQRLRRSGILFYGPPGTGKTLMGKAIATECRCRFLSVKGPELMNMYVGQSEKNIREVFDKARSAAPCVIFFDEIDSFASKRRNTSGVSNRVVSQLLAEMDGMKSNEGIFIVGATNRPDLIDPALMRPGRFDKMFYVGVCDTAQQKLNVLKALTRRFVFHSEVKLEDVVGKLPRFVTGADIYSISSGAWYGALRRKLFINDKAAPPEVVVKMKDFEDSLNNFVPSVTEKDLQYYNNFRETGK